MSTIDSAPQTIAAQKRKVAQLRSGYRSELEKELAEVRAKISQLEPNLHKSLYRQGLLALRAPQAGVIKDLATTTVGAVVQPGTVMFTLVPEGEKLYADVSIRNEDVGFVVAGQHAQIKLAAYPFQKHGMLSGKIIHVSADAVEATRKNNGSPPGDEATAELGQSTYKARIQLDQQVLINSQGEPLKLSSGMQITAEINEGKRTVMEYLLSPVQKVVKEAARER